MDWVKGSGRKNNLGPGGHPLGLILMLEVYTGDCVFLVAKRRALSPSANAVQVEPERTNINA